MGRMIPTEMDFRQEDIDHLDSYVPVSPLPLVSGTTAGVGSSLLAIRNEPAENIYLDYAGMNPRPSTTSDRYSRGVDRNNQAYWRRRVAEERKELEEDGQRAWQDLVRMRRLKEKMLLENRELIRDTARLKGDVSRLTSALATSQAEVKRLKERYEETWKDKVALQEELSGPASLPLELLINIAGFVAGNDSYGTLLNLSLMSKRLRKETIPTLYETIIWNSKGYLYFDKHVRNSRMSGQSDYIHTKFIYTTGNQFLDAKALFRSLRLQIHRSHSTLLDRHDEDRQRRDGTLFTGYLTIYQPIHVDTITSLLRTPFCWTHERAAEKRFSPIIGISRVDIHRDAAILPCKVPGRNTYFLNQTRAIDIVTVNNAHPNKNYTATVNELVKWAPTAAENQGRMSATMDRRYIVGDVTSAKLQVWIDAVSVSLSFRESVARHEFRQYFLSAAAVYANLWSTVRDAHNQNLHPVTLFKLSSSLDSPEDHVSDSGDDDTDHGSEFDLDITLEGNLKFEPGKDIFKVDIIQYNESTGRHTHILNEWYDPEKHKPEPRADRAISVSMDSAASDEV
ncbi:hypothetical protein QFC22_002503 [Naganishia vaughanmartiniae]|uniref:Uncharacterized protein n=1 Tax=Naganishia vaughanmartiniae TaxID=1424756 RepID=A0ACC2XB01_9TREE|nr:hypothetical protein QFC22_002503 [Naganishia vaughanmartiniae]